MHRTFGHEFNPGWSSPWSVPRGSADGSVPTIPSVVEGLTNAFHMRTRWHLAELSYIVQATGLKVYEEYGLESVEQWLSVHFGVGFNKACETVNIALMLDELPSMRAAYGRGEISYDHLRALVRVATPENEQELLDKAKGLTVSKTYKLVERILALCADDSQEVRKQRYLEMRWDKERRCLMFWGELPEDEGAAFKKAIDSMAKSLPVVPDEDEQFTPMAAKRADALCEMASSALAEDAAKPSVLVHVDARGLNEHAAEEAPAAESSQPAGANTSLIPVRPSAILEGGCIIPVGVAKRLCCDAIVQLVIDDESGAPLGLGRRRRTVSPRLRTGLMNRDNGCVWHGCTTKVNLEAHHIIAWEDGGPTDYDNLLLLCKVHHHAVHEGEFR